MAGLLISGLLCGDALAEPTPEDKATARTLVKSGRVKKRRGDLDGALADFQAAHEIMGVPTTGFELGKAQAAAGRLVEALDTLLAVARSEKRPREPLAFRNARDDAKKLAQELEADVPSLLISLGGGSADGATVTIDGREQKAAAVGAPIKVNPGERMVEATAVDGVRASQTVTLARGDNKELTLVLEPAAVDVPTVSDSGDGTTINPMVWAGFGVGAAGLTVGAITGSIAIAKFGDVAPQCPEGRCPPDVHDDVDSGTTLGTVSTIAFIVGGVGVAVGVVGLFFPLSDEGDETVSVRLSPGGVSFGGVW